MCQAMLSLLLLLLLLLSMLPSSTRTNECFVTFSVCLFCFSALYCWPHGLGTAPPRALPALLRCLRFFVPDGNGPSRGFRRGAATPGGARAWGGRGEGGGGAAVICLSAAGGGKAPPRYRIQGTRVTGPLLRRGGLCGGVSCR